MAFASAKRDLVCSLKGESANIFDGIEEDELGNKLKETMDDLGGFFKNMGLNMDQTQEEEKQSTPDCDASSGLPNIENLQDHLKSLFDGKIGKLAKDLETGSYLYVKLNVVNGVPDIYHL